MFTEIYNYIKNLKGWQKIVGIVALLALILVSLVSCKSLYVESEGTYKIIKEGK